MKARTAAVKHSGEVARAQSKLHDAEGLRDAEAAERRRDAGKQKQELKKREREEKRERERLEREEQRRRDSEQRATAEQARRISDLQRQTVGLRTQLEEVSRYNAPAEIIVLFLASSPEDEAQLRLDKEIREIEIRLRTTEHRESIRFVPKVARQLTDLVQDLNEVRPHVVHFSGHGNQTELAFAARSRPRASRTDPTALASRWLRLPSQWHWKSSRQRSKRRASRSSGAIHQ